MKSRGTYEIVKIISEHKKIKHGKPLSKGMKRVEAIVREGRFLVTRHLDVPAERLTERAVQ